MLIDITRTIGLDTPAYPGDTGPRLLRTDSLEAGGICNVSRLELSSHAGTHLDAPAHFIPGGATIEELPIERFHLPAVVVDTGAAGLIRSEHLTGAGIGTGDAVLFKTANGQLPRDAYTNDFVCLSAETAQTLVDQGVTLVGIDYLSVERDGDPAAPVHKILLGAGLIILEDADLREVASGRYILTCFPLKLHGTEASPCRAVLHSAD